MPSSLISTRRARSRCTRTLGQPCLHSFQGAHAAVAAVTAGVSSDDADSREYTSSANLPRMHKAVLEVKGLTQLENLAAKLDAASVRHYLWREQPENVATALATWPARKSTLQPHFKKLQLSSWYEDWLKSLSCGNQSSTDWNVHSGWLWQHAYRWKMCRS